MWAWIRAWFYSGKHRKHAAPQVIDLRDRLRTEQKGSNDSR